MSRPFRPEPLQKRGETKRRMDALFSWVARAVPELSERPSRDLPSEASWRLLWGCLAASRGSLGT
eukprot:5287798-Pyramimonas_sp.AAC.1